MPYRRILKSTFIMGGSSVFITVLGIVRTKIIAMMLGPFGIGLAGIYMTVTGLMGTISGLGIFESGVRQIAEASGTGDQRVISRTVLTIRRTALLSGVAGLCILLLFNSSISRLTFGNSNHGFDLAILSITIFFGAVSGGQTALIQGMRRIGDLAKLSMLGAIYGTVFSIPIIYFFGERGIAYFLLIGSATGILTSWWYCRKIDIPVVTMTWQESFSDAKPLLKLGSAIMGGSLLIAGTQYLLRVFVVRYLGVDAAGVSQASTTLCLVYVGVILKAMVTDFYPRLAAVSGNNDECKSLINKQIEVGLLLAVPGILAIMTFAPFVITIFYSSKFMLAVDILRWQILGVLLQVVTWPMGFIFRAKGNGKLFFWTEVFANGMHLGLAWLGIVYFGLPGIGMAFFAMNASYFVLIIWIVSATYNFGFSRINLKLFATFGLAIGVIFLTPYCLPKVAGLFLDTGIAVLAGLYSLKTLFLRANIETMPGFVVKLKSCFSLLN